jgi:sporulation protein YlmC with PRC-barrel domain
VRLIIFIGGETLMKSILAVSVAALLTAPALVQAQQATPDRPPSPAAGSAGKAEQGARKASDRINVAAARNIVGDEVRDQAGKDLGTVEYLLIGIQDARVRYAVVAPEEGETDQLVPVPWTALNTGRVGDDVLTTDRETFSKQQKYKQEQIAELTQPSVITRIYEVWAPVSQKAQAGKRSTEGQGQQQGQQQAGKQGEQKQGERQQGDQGTPHFLVGRDVVATVLPPVFRASDELRGSEVYSSDNKEFGQIDDLMIDLDHGRLAYVQVAHGGFLGLGEEITPIPFGALSYDHERNAYRVARSESELQKVQRFARGDQPRSVQSSDLNKLYKDFGVQPYWQDKS